VDIHNGRWIGAASMVWRHWRSYRPALPAPPIDLAAATFAALATTETGGAREGRCASALGSSGSEHPLLPMTA
jgi:hypothetical protein